MMLVGAYEIRSKKNHANAIIFRNSCNNWIQNYTSAKFHVNGYWDTEWKDFLDKLDASFTDNMRAEKARAKLDLIQQHQNETADDFFKRFNVLLNQSGRKEYNDIAITKAGNGMNRSLVEKMYLGETLPTAWATWKAKAIRLDKMWQKHQEQQKARGWTSRSHDQKSPPATQPSVPRASPTPIPQADRRDGTGITYGGQGKPMELDRAKKPFNCYNCGKPMHMSRNCPDKCLTTIHSLYAKTTKEERNVLAKEWGFVVAPQ